MAIGVGVGSVKTKVNVEEPTTRISMELIPIAISRKNLPLVYTIAIFSILWSLIQFCLHCWILVVEARTLPYNEVHYAGFLLWLMLMSMSFSLFFGIYFRKRFLIYPWMLMIDFMAFACLIIALKCLYQVATCGDNKYHDRFVEMMTGFIYWFILSRVSKCFNPAEPPRLPKPKVNGSGNISKNKKNPSDAKVNLDVDNISSSNVNVNSNPKDSSIV